MHLPFPSHPFSDPTEKRRINQTLEEWEKKKKEDPLVSHMHTKGACSCLLHPEHFLKLVFISEA